MNESTGIPFLCHQPVLRNDTLRMQIHVTPAVMSAKFHCQDLKLEFVACHKCHFKLPSIPLSQEKNSSETKIHLFWLKQKA